MRAPPSSASTTRVLVLPSRDWTCHALRARGRYHTNAPTRAAGPAKRNSVLEPDRRPQRARVLEKRSLIESNS